MRTIRHDLLFGVTDAELGAFAEGAIRLLAGDGIGPLTRHDESHRSEDGDEYGSYRLGNERMGLVVREEQYTHDAGGFNNLPCGSLLAFASYGLPPPLTLEARRKVDESDRARVQVTFTGPEPAAEACEEAFCQTVARMPRADVMALDALRLVPDFPETALFALPDRALSSTLAKVAPENAALVVAARDALAAVAHDACRSFWLGAAEAKLGDLERAAAALSVAHAQAPESATIALTAANVLLDLGRNADVVALLSSVPPSDPSARRERSELLALALLRLGRPQDALAALEGQRGGARARLLDATGDRNGAVRELRHAFLEDPDQARRFQEGVAMPRARLAKPAPWPWLSVLIDEDWILEMWGDPRVAPLLKANFKRDRRSYAALLALEDIPPFEHDLDVTGDVAPEAVVVATAAAANIDPAKRDKLDEALALLRTLARGNDSLPGIHLRMALLSMMLGCPDEALRLFEHVYIRSRGNAAAARGFYHFTLSPRLEADRMVYAASSVGTEDFVVVARTNGHVAWEQRITVQTLPERMKLSLEEEAPRLVLVLEIDGEHPRGGDAIRDRVFFDPSTGAVLGRKGFAR